MFTRKSVGTGPSSYEERIYRAAVSQRLRNTVVHRALSRQASTVEFGDLVSNPICRLSISVDTNEPPPPVPFPRTRSTFAFPRYRDVSTSSPLPQQQTPCHTTNVNNNANGYCCVLRNYTRDSLQLEHPRSSRQTAPVVQLIMDYTLYTTAAIRATFPEFQNS